uniref:Ribosomal protein L29 n=1 Tax=Spumella sp. Baekdong012001B8 TaxID=2782410 RepID=A0A7S6PVA3_9STRA|nr:ribosomal protein L29 [Spumella sp. Baekdong012001B8]
MTLFKYSELKSFNNIQAIDTEIVRLRKILVELRLKIFLAEAKETHLIAHTKKKIAQLYFKKREMALSSYNTSAFVSR